MNSDLLALSMGALVLAMGALVLAMTIGALLSMGAALSVTTRRFEWYAIKY